MIQIYADGVLAYDSRLDEYDLQGLKRTRGLNKGGTAEITMPTHHPAYSRFTGYKTIVEIFRDGKLKFRGRALYPVDDFDNNRTVICEGELCFFQDAIVRPYLYQDTPAVIFADLVRIYNSQVEPFKQFKLGTVTVTDPNDYLRLESESAENVLAVFNKLVERCGGYIVFTTDDSGARVVHWLATVGRHSGQVIEMGENLFSFSRSGANTDLATALLPYGAKNETTGERLTIASVNGGKDYIVDEAAVKIRGTIMKTAYWDDVTDPANLLKKARQYLDECKLVITSLQLTALDLSYVDKTVDCFEEGDLIRVVSKAHGLDEDFQLVDIAENMLDPAGDGLINLGKELRTLTSQDVAGDRKSASDLQKTTAAIKSDFEINVEKVAEAVETKLSSEIKQTADAVLVEVGKTYATTETLSTSIKALADSITLEASGSLGGKASIKLSVNGAETTETLDLTKIREAFAGDTTAVEISGGTITFSSNTLIINSTNLQLSANGTITAKNVELSGNLTTTSGLYASKLTSGKLRFDYENIELGSFASTYYTEDASKRGVAIHLEAAASFISFSQDPDGDSTYTPDYIINYGMNPDGLTERHIFYNTVRFLGSVNFNHNLTLANNYGIKCIDTEGNADWVLFMSEQNNVCVGSLNYATYVRGSALYLGRSDQPTEIYGSTLTIKNKATFADRATFNSNLALANTFGIKCFDTEGAEDWVLFMSNANEFCLGSLDYPTYVRGSALYLGRSDAPTEIWGDGITIKSATSIEGTATFTTAAYFSSNIVFNNNYGVRLRLKGSTTSVLVLNMTTSDTVRCGHSDYVLNVYGESINLNNPIYLKSTTYCSYNLYIANQYCLRTYTTDGVGAEAVWMSSDNYLYIGGLDYPTYVRGSTLHLGRTDVNTKIYGAWIYMNSKVYCNGVPIVFANGYGIQLRDKSGTDNYALSMTSSNQVMVGAADYQLRLRGSTVVLNSSGATVSSDRRLKNSIEALPAAYEEFLDRLTPSRFKFNDGTSGRYHMGFIAQEVQEALEAAGLTTQDFGGYVDLNGDGTELGLIYTEFIALLLHKIQRQEQRIAALEAAK